MLIDILRLASIFVAASLLPLWWFVRRSRRGKEHGRQSQNQWWRRIDWPDLVMRELLAAVLTSAVLSAVIYTVESRREQRIFETSERLENVRFVRQLAISSPDGPKPLVGIDLHDTQLAGLNLSNANLSGADLSDASLSAANLTATNLSGANLSGVYLRGANLSSAKLTGADITGADLTGTNLSRADFSNADVTGTDLIGTDLTDAVLFGADLISVDLRSANLSGADLGNTDLSSAALSGVWWCPESPPNWPRGFEPHQSAVPRHGDSCH